MVLLTGATGFLGSHILQKLVDAGWEVCCTKRKSSDFCRVAGIADKCRWHDLEPGAIEGMFQAYPIQMVIHCATNYGRDGQGYFDVYRANVAFPLELLENALKYGSKYFINTDTFFVKSMQCLQADGGKLYKNAYTKTKYLFTYIVKGQIEEWDIAFLNLQLEHVYGMGDNEGKFVASMLRQLQEGRAQIELTEGTQIRDWVYIEDVLNAYMAVIQNRTQFKVREFYQIEVGTGEGRSLREFVEAAKSLTGSQTVLLFGRKQMEQGELLYSCANTQALHGLGWKAQYGIEEGLKDMVRKR